jgi:hypothetical protein
MTEDLRTEEQTAVEAAVVRALERRPEITIPEGFAARVARSMPAKVPRRGAIRPGFGRAAAYLAIAAIIPVLALMTWEHPKALEAGRGILFVVEVLLLGQLLAVGLWLGMRSGGTD